MRRRAGSGFPRSPQLSPEQAANRVFVPRVGTDSGERTPMARHGNSHISILIIGESRKANAAPRLIVCRIKRSPLRAANPLAIANRSALAEGEFVTAFRELGYIRFPQELKSRY